MASGTDRDNPRIPFTTRVWRRFLDRLGFRNRVFSDTDTGLMPSSEGVTSTWVMQADGSWAAPSGGGGGAWGSITGTLADQTDLVSEFATKADDGDVTASGLTMATSRILGRTTASDGAVEEISVGSNLTLSGGVLDGIAAPAAITALTGDVTATGPGSVAGTIAEEAVTYAKMQHVSATDRLLGRQTSGAGDVEEVTCTDTGFSLLASSVARDEMFYGSNTDTVDTFATTSGGRALLNVLSAAADRLPYFTGASAVAVATFTSYARTLLALASKDAVRSELACPYVIAQESEGSQVGASSTAFHELFSFTIPAGALGTTGRASIEYEIEHFAASGTSKHQWKQNSTVVYGPKAGGQPPADSSSRFIVGRAYVANNGSTSSQRGGGSMHVSDQGTSGVGVGGHWFGDSRGSEHFADGTEDTTSAMTISLEVGFSTSHASNYFRLVSARCVIEPSI